MTRNVPVKKIVRIVASVLFFAIVISYGILRSWDILFGISLDINGLTSGESVTQSVLNLNGTAKHAVGIIVNGQSAVLSDNGEWKDTIALLPGYNTISVIATDKFGKTVKKEIVVFYNVPPPPITPDPEANSIVVPQTTESGQGAVQ